MTSNFEQDLVLITAASGKQASAYLPRLVKTWKRLRLQCVSDSSRTRLQQQYPNAEVVQTRFDDLPSAKRLLEGVTACVLTLPAFHPREAQHGTNMIDAAVENGLAGGPFKHMVFSSVLHSSLRAMANHDNKRLVEEALIESDLSYTIVQPANLMDNVPIGLIAQQEDPVFPARFNPATKFTFTATHDLGEVIATILEEREEHSYSIYPLVSSAKPMDHFEAMSIASQVVGKKITIRRLSLEDAVGEFSKAIPQGTSDQDRKAILRGVARMLVFYESKGLVGNPKVMEMLLKRKPLSYREWVTMQLQA